MFYQKARLRAGLTFLPNRKRSPVALRRMKFAGTAVSRRRHANLQQIPFEGINPELFLALVWAGQIEVIDGGRRLRGVEW